MKKILIFSLALTLASAAAYADVAKQDGLLRAAKTSYEAGTLPHGKAITIKEGREMIECVIKSSDPDATSVAIAGVGGERRALLGRIMTALIPLDSINEISGREEVIYMEAAKPMTAKMNEARTPTNVVSVQEGTGLDKAYNGKNVLVGVVDTDLDWQHDDFKQSGSTRICYLNQKTFSGSTRECSRSDIINNNCNVTQGGANFHGTHVTGIAAGSNSTYKGVAPESNIAFVFNASTDPDTSGTDPTSFSTTVLEGVAAIFDKADEFDMPAVVNLSLGTSIGAHDDTSLLEEGLNEALLDSSGNPKAGRAIVDAAGNENLNINDPDYIAGVIGGIHAPISISAPTRSGYGVAIRNEQISGYAWNDAAIVDVWLADNSDCRDAKIEVMAYRRIDYPPANTSSARITTDAIDFNSDQSSTKTTADNKVTVSVYTYTANAQNNRPEAIILIGPKAGSGSWTDIVMASDANVGYFFDVIIEGVATGTCTGDMWQYPDQTALIDFTTLAPTPVPGTGAYQYADGDSNKTITVPGTASGVITVGSFMDHTDGTWTNIDGVTYDQTDYAVSGTGGTVGSISLFSSLGPTGETTAFRTKPDLVAPGEPIVSTLASAYTPPTQILVDEEHFKLEGSSMSSPHVTGIVALMFEKNNCLTASQAKNTLTTTASPVGSTVPNDTYGYGKVNALAAMVALTADSSCYSGTCTGGSDGGGGCGGTVVPVSAPTDILSLLSIALPLGILVAGRVRRTFKN